MKTLAQIKKLPFILHVIDEREDGIWVYLKETYINTENGCRIIHEHSVKEINDKLQYVKSIN